MATRDAVEETLKYWAEISSLLERNELAALAIQLDETGGPISTDIFQWLLTTMAPALTHVDSVWDQLENGNRRLRVAGDNYVRLDDLQLVSRLRAQVAESLRGAIENQTEEERDLDGALARKLAGIPVFREMLAPPGAIAIIVDGRPAVPTFQVGLAPGKEVDDPGALRVYPVVARVNEALSADIDPVGVTLWWVTRNPWIDSAPADFIGTEREDEINYAADQLTNDSY